MREIKHNYEELDEMIDKHKNSLTNVWNVDIMQEISYIIAMTKTDEQNAQESRGGWKPGSADVQTPIPSELKIRKECESIE